VFISGFFFKGGLFRLDSNISEMLVCSLKSKKKGLFPKETLVVTNGHQFIKYPVLKGLVSLQ